MTVKKAALVRQVWFLGTAWLVIGVDQFTKHLAIQNLEFAKPVDFLGSIVRLNLLYNDSAAFSLGFGATWIFTLLSTLATLTLLWFSRKIQSTSWALMGGILLGGVVGNLIDRLTRDPGFAIGHVVDFIQIPFNFAVFNIADIAIVSMCVLAAIRVIRGEKIGQN